MIAVLDRMEFYFGKNKLVMEWRGRKDRTAFQFSGLDSASGFAALPAVMGIARTWGKNKAKMATSLRKICKIVRRLGGCGECELESRCLWSEFQSSQSVCFLALKYFLFLPPWFTGSWGGSFLLLF